MLRPERSAQVHLYAGVDDMRKSIDGLAVLVEQDMKLSPMQPALFVFCNRQRDKIKLLYWERNGFVLWYKRLEKQRFKWLKTLSASESFSIAGYELNLLLDGLDIFNNKPHEALFYENVS